LHGFRYVLERLLSEISKLNVQFVSHTFAHHRGDTNATRIAQTFEPRGYVYAITVNIFTLDYHIAEMNADAKQHLAFVRFRILVGDYTVLDIDRALNGFNDTSELYEEAITHRLYKPPVMLIYGGRYDRTMLFIESGTCTCFILSHQSRVPDHIGCQDSR
jgi:hypothetical protein